MERAHFDFDQYFSVTLETDEAQAAEMTIEPGRAVGGPENDHGDSGQWLSVVSGTGVATVAGESERIEAGDHLLIEAGEAHGIENDDEGPLATVNFYTPPWNDR